MNEKFFSGSNPGHGKTTKIKKNNKNCRSNDKPSPEDGSRFNSRNIVSKTLWTKDSIQEIYVTNQTPFSQSFRASFNNF